MVGAFPRHSRKGVLAFFIEGKDARGPVVPENGPKGVVYTPYGAFFATYRDGVVPLMKSSVVDRYAL